MSQREEGTSRQEHIQNDGGRKDRRRDRKTKKERRDMEKENRET